jgi:hypothetical protein
MAGNNIGYPGYIHAGTLSGFTPERNRKKEVWPFAEVIVPIQNKNNGVA